MAAARTIIPAQRLQGSRIILAGGTGFLGSAVRRALLVRGVPDEAIVRAGRGLADLTDRAATRNFLRTHAPTGSATIVINCAGAIGGIQANSDQPGRFFHDNLTIAMNLIEEFRLAGLIDRGGAFVQIGSMTSYPADAPIPFRESDLWRGYPDAGIAPYAVAKLAAWQMLDAYHKQYGLRGAYVIPVNLYGPGDNIGNERNAHVAGTLIKRFVDATRAGTLEVVNWGSGEPTRDFLYVEDAAEGVVRAAEQALTVSGEPTPINLGSGREVSIKSLAEMIGGLAGFTGTVRWDTTKPDGQPRRCLDTTRARELLDWSALMPLEEGLRRTIEWYKSLPLDAPKP